MHVLVVDDSPGVREALQLAFTLRGHEVEVAASPSRAIAIVREGQTGVVVQDMNFSKAATTGEEGRQLFHDLRAIDPDLPVILMTAWTDVQMAVEFVQLGADDYIGKPWNDELLVDKVARLLAARQLRVAREVGAVDLAGLVYASAELHAVVRLVRRVAPSDVPLLITGPSGTGKERVAALVHANSTRKRDPFVAVNAGALPDNLVEAELFGVEPGAFTGAQRRVGLLEEADGGTLFLDEAGTLSPSAQAALLRVLETGEYRRLGSSRTRRANVRVVAATNADLRRAIRDGGFREDLYFRLAVVEVAVPPLSARPDDVDVLTDHFLEASGLTGDHLTGAAREALRAHPWPGNVRELRNVIQRAALVRSGERIGVADLGLRGQPPRLEGAEAAEVRAALRGASGVVSQAAATLGISRQALYRKMARLGISVERTVKR